MARDRQIDPGTLRKLFRRMGPHLRPHRRTLLIAVLAMLGASVMEVLRPWPLKIIFDGLLIPGEKPDAITGWALETFGADNGLLAAASLAILMIAVIGGIFAFFQSFLIAATGQKVVAEIRLGLYCHIQRLSHSFHDQSSAGDLLARLTGDVRMMRDLLINTTIYFSARILVIVGTVTVMALMDWRLTLCAVVILPLLAIVSRRFGEEIKGAARRQRRKEGKIAMVMGENISAISIVQGFAREAHEEARFAKQNNSSAQAGLQATRLEAHMDRLVHVILASGTCLVVWYGVTRVQAGAITPGDLLVFTAYLAALYKPVRRLAAMTGRIAKATASGERLLEILELEPEVQEKPDATHAPAFNGVVRFEDLSFRYPAGGQVLEKANLQIQPGECLALVGKSGAGKSTVGRLLLRFYDPTEGRITIDGHDLRDLTLASLREQISVVLQDSILFATTIRANIAYGRLDATDAEIYEAAKAAGAHGFIQELPDGYDTVIGERGATLSGGQRQRVAIARAILRDAPILILDEPLTGLDAATAGQVSEALGVAAKGRTTLLIAHDDVSLSIADRVVEIRDHQLLKEPRLAPRERRAG